MFRFTRMIRTCGLVAAAAAVAIAAPPTTAEGTPSPPNELQQTGTRVEVGAPVTPHVWNGDTRELEAPPAWLPGDPVKEIPRRMYPRPGWVEPTYETGRDPLVDLQRDWVDTPIDSAPLPGTAEFTAITRNFAGGGYTGVNPPDTCGDVGPDHYIQMINAGGGAQVRIWDKAEPTPNLLSTFALDSLGSGSCASGLGDPIVLYDRFAERWVLTEFSGSGNNLCVYVSQTTDPVSGGWYNYGFQAPSFPDYPKYGVWPTDANGGDGSYVVTANDGGPGIYALDRGAMLVGAAATFQRVTIPGLPGFGFEAPTPADLDSYNPPPAGAEAIIMRHRDTENHSGPAAPGDLLEMWTFDVDWNNTANSVLSAAPSIDVAEFDSSLCGLTSFFCFPQPGTGTTLDPLREVIMNRLQYVNHGEFETLAGNLVTDIDGANTGGLRWFELRRSGGPGNPWTLYQEGTYSIDDDNRWMAASAMDQSQNFAIAYNVSSSTTDPSLRYTGRLADDPLGVLTAPETSIAAGTSFNSSNRYGDYSSMNLDPADDCTFWFTGEWNASTTWSTRIASFGFEACGCELRPGALTVDAAVAGDNAVELTWNDADLETVVEYRVFRARAAGGPYSRIATVADTSPGVAGDPTPYAYEDQGVSGGIEYFYIVRASDGAACTSEASVEKSVTATGACTLDPLFAGIQAVSAPPFGVCKLDLFWGDATPECDGPVTYDVFRSTDSQFTPGDGNRIAQGVVGNTLEDINALVDGVTYYYAVRAIDQSNGKDDGNVVRLSAAPQGVGGACTTGSSCAENPFVDVDPEGPLTVCQGDGPVLGATLSSGSGPFLYQWYENGVAVPGATGPQFLTTKLGTNTYNVRVRSEACPDEVFDGLDTVIERVNRPFFDGVQSVVNPKNQTCTLNVSWNPGVTVCDGPVRYFVYRDTQSNVQPTAENLVAAGVTGTSYSDAVDLANEQTYHYLVQAQDVATGQLDGNTVTKLGKPDGPLDGINAVYLEDFGDAGTFDDWTVTIGPGSHSCGEWSLTSVSGSRPFGGSGQYAWANSNCGVIAPRTSATLDSPPIDTDYVGLNGVELKVNLRYDYGNGDDTSISVWDGAQWVLIWTAPAGNVNSELTFDVLQYAEGNDQFRVRFDYQNANADGFFSIDNVRVETDLFRPCDTGATGPARVPDGALGTTPLLAESLDETGSSIQVSWDATSCGSVDYNLLWGDLADVASYTLGGAECSVSPGSFLWNDVPAGDLFWLVVGTDGAGTESSWGYDGGGGERNGAVGSGACGTTVKDPTGVCP